MKKANNLIESMLNRKWEYSLYLNRLIEIACTRFKWKNMPDTIDVRYLELTLFRMGQSVFFKDEAVGFLALPNIMQGQFDVYGVPTERTAFSSYNGYTNRLNIKDSVIIYNNYLRYGSYDTVLEYAKRLSLIDEIISINVEAQRTPVLIQGTEDQRLTLKNLYAQYRGNVPFVFGDKDLDKNSISVLKTDAPFTAPQLYELKEKYWNEALTYLGVSSGNEKKERMIVDEVQFNLGGTNASIKSALESRQQACEKINAMFGLDIECELNEDYIESTGDNNE